MTARRPRSPAVPARPEVLAAHRYNPPLERRRGKLRLDFNENTTGCSPAVVRALHRLDAEALATYPEYGRLLQVLARHLGVPADHLLPTGGVDEALHLLVEAFVRPRDAVVTPVPGFVMYRVYADLAGAPLRTVPWPPGAPFPEAAMRRAMRGAKLAIVASPNNPTGAVAPPAALRRLLAARPRCLLAVDEAYFEFHGVTALPLLRRHGNLVVLRTFSKAYGLASLRLGVAVARPEMIDCLARVRSPYSVNGLAALLAETALRDRSFVRRHAAAVRRERDRMRRELGRRDLPTYPSAANFLLARCGAAAGRIERALRTRGILVRDQSAQPGLQGCIRVGIGTRAQNARFLAALDEILAARTRKARR